MTRNQLNDPFDGGNVLRAVIYARVSTDDSDQSVENQLPLCRKWCENHGVEVDSEYYEDYTGSTLNRPKFREMLGRLDLGGITYVVAYDQSRLTRCKQTWGNFDKVKEIIQSKGAVVRFVSTDVDPQSDAGEILSKFNDIANAKYNEDLSRRTTIGMGRKRAEGKHMGLPAAFMFEEDIKDAPEGRYVRPDTEHGIIGTRTVTEAYLMSLAREGVSIQKAAEYIGISPNTLVAEMKPREQVPHRRLKKTAVAKMKDPAYRVKDTDYVTFYRFKGTKDRYTPYVTLYEEARKARKGVASETVCYGDENTSERVVP